MGLQTSRNLKAGDTIGTSSHSKKAGMSKFGLYGKIIAHPGQRDALIAGLLEAAAMMQHMPGCELYIVNVSATEPEAVWVTEVWSSSADHQASLTREEVRALIQKNRPLIAGGERIEILPIGGKGLPPD
jgi:quinol monooxygenase YgiN